MPDRVIVSIEDEFGEAVATYARLLPAWFVPRMMSDNWAFVLLTTHGQAILIDHIDRVIQAADGSIWLDVSLMTECPWEHGIRQMGLQIITAPTSRTTASVNAAHIIAAFEIEDT